MDPQPPKSWFAPNIGTAGRVMRISLGLLALGGAGWLWSQQQLVGAAGLVLLAAFLLFEGLRGWCALRACKIRTPL